MTDIHLQGDNQTGANEISKKEKWIITWNLRWESQNMCALLRKQKPTNTKVELTDGFFLDKERWLSYTRRAWESDTYVLHMHKIYWTGKFRQNINPTDMSPIKA